MSAPKLSVFSMHTHAAQYESALLDTCGELHRNKLDSLHHRTALLPLPDKASTDEKLRALSILLFPKQQDFNKAHFVFKVNRGVISSHVTSIFSNNNDTYRYVLPISHTDLYKRKGSLTTAIETIRDYQRFRCPRQAMYLQ